MKKIFRYFEYNIPMLMLILITIIESTFISTSIINKKAPNCDPYDWGLLVVWIVMVLIIGGLGYFAGRADQYRSQWNNEERD